MANKSEERDWSEIIAEVRSKAQSEIDEFVDEMKPRVQAIVEKVRKANFHEEAEEFLGKLKKLADEFSHSEDGPKAKSSPAKSKTRAPLYRDADGREWGRAPKGWTDAQKKKYRIK